MKPLSCLSFCSQGSNGATMQYAGIEYGRECYCGAYLSTLSTKFDNESAHCVYACEGNSSEVCGGALALTLYNLTDNASGKSSSKTGLAWSFTEQSAWYGMAAVVSLVVAAVL
jgi:hypothetical protein